MQETFSSTNAIERKIKMNITVVGIGTRNKNCEFKKYLSFKNCGETDSSVIAKNVCEKKKEELREHNLKIQAIRHRRNVAVEPYKNSLVVGGKDAEVKTKMDRIGMDIVAYERARNVLPYADPVRDILTKKIEDAKNEITTLQTSLNVGLTQADRCRLIEKFRNSWDAECLTKEERELVKIGDKPSFEYTFIVRDLPVEENGK